MIYVINIYYKSMSLEDRMEQLEAEVVELRQILGLIHGVCDFCHKILNPNNKCKGCKNSYCPSCDPFYDENYLEGYCNIDCARCYWISRCMDSYPPDQENIDKINMLLDQKKADMVADKV
jgi:hypothetical protein